MNSPAKVVVPSGKGWCTIRQRLVNRLIKIGVPSGKRLVYHLIKFGVLYTIQQILMYSTIKKIRAGNSLICSFWPKQMSNCERFAQIAQDKWATVSESLRSLKTNEQSWANRSGRSCQMSNREQFTQVAHDKWANEPFAQKN